MVDKLLGNGPGFIGDRGCGMAFWQELWQAMRLEEKIVPFEDLPDLALPAGLDVPGSKTFWKKRPAICASTSVRERSKAS